MKEIWPWILLAVFVIGNVVLYSWCIYKWWKENEVGSKLRWFIENNRGIILLFVVVAVFVGLSLLSSLKRGTATNIDPEKELRDELYSAICETLDSADIFLSENQRAELAEKLVSSVLPICEDKIDKEYGYYDDDVEYDEHGMRQ